MSVIGKFALNFSNEGGSWTASPAFRSVHQSPYGAVHLIHDRWVTNDDGATWNWEQPRSLCGRFTARPNVEACQAKHAHKHCKVCERLADKVEAVR